MKIALILIAILLSGCVPIPHRDYQAHQVTGTVVRNGAPVSGVTVRLSIRNGKFLTTVSDQQGHFQIGPITEFRWFVSMGDEFNTPRLTLSVGDADLDGGHLSEVSKSEVICNLVPPSNPNLPYCQSLGEGP